MELNEILEALKSLTDEQKAKVRDALAAAPPKETPETEGEASAEETPEAEGEPEASETLAESAGEQLEGEQSTEAEQTEGGESGEAQEPPTEALEANAGDIGGVGEDEPIPEMTKEPQGQAGHQAPQAPPAVEEQTAEPQEPPIEPVPLLEDEQGEEMPLDYQQIIDGLNAKNMALEAENKQLKAKVEGAFGLTGKPSGFAKANPLYDDATDIPPMRKKY